MRKILLFSFVFGFLMVACSSEEAATPAPEKSHWRLSIIQSITGILGGA